MPQTKSCFTASQKEKKGVGSTSCHFTLNLVSLVERPFRIKIDVYWWGNSVPRLFMFKLLAGNGTTFEALEHNGALDTGSWERRELDAIQGLKQPSRKRSRGMMEDCLLFPVLSSSGRLSPVRMAQLTPSIAANSNKQDFFFFTRWSNTGDESPPEWRVFLRGWRVKDVTQCAGPPLERRCWSVLSARCCCVPSLLGLIRSYSAVLTSLTPGRRLVSLFCEQIQSQTMWDPKIKCKPQKKKQCWCLCSSSSLEAEIQLGRKHQQTFNPRRSSMGPTTGDDICDELPRDKIQSILFY